MHHHTVLLCNKDEKCPLPVGTVANGETRNGAALSLKMYG